MAKRAKKAIASKPKARRPGNPAWKKGVSGNPSGRPKIPKEIKEAFRDLTPAAIDTLNMAMAEADWPIKVKAAKIILDRAYGKPVQPIAGDDDAPPIRIFREMSNDELRRLSTLGKKQR